MFWINLQAGSIYSGSKRALSADFVAPSEPPPGVTHAVLDETGAFVGWADPPAPPPDWQALTDLIVNPVLESLISGYDAASVGHTFKKDGSNGAWSAESGGGGLTLLGRTTLTTRSSFSGAIPFDDTIPQITEGTELMTLEVTPSAADKSLWIRCLAWLGETSNTSNVIIGALFVDSTADAILAGWLGTSGGGGFVSALTNGFLLLEGRIPAVSTAARTYRFRAGADNSGAISVNGVGSIRRLGGSAVSFIEVFEY